MRSLLTPVLLLAAACQQEPSTSGASGQIPAGEAPPTATVFRFDMSRADAFTVTARDSAQRPLAGVQVVVRASSVMADDGVTMPGAILYTGLTGPDGRCQDRLDHPLDLSEVEVTLLRSGYQGRYDHPERRAAYGEHAPAAWFTARIEDMTALNVDLTATSEVK